MTLTVQLPESVEQRLRSRALASGQPVEEFAANLLESATDEDWLDHDFHNECELDHSAEVSLADVRKILAKIPGNMTDDFIAERDER